MPQVIGFRGYRFCQEKVVRFDRVVTPPFDVISPEDRARLAQQSPYNMVHVILPGSRTSGDKYAEAGSRFQSWIDSGIMRRDDEDSLYLLEQRFQGIDGAAYLRRSFYALARLPERGERTILGHEKTFPAKIQDRLALTRAARSLFGGVFVLYEDPQKRLNGLFDATTARDPDVEATTFDGVVQRLWRTSFPSDVTEFFDGRTLYILDGHHRFATALAYRDERRTVERHGKIRPCDFVMLGFVEAADPGLLVYPAHRVLDLPGDWTPQDVCARLENSFEIASVNGNLPEKVRKAPGCVIGLVFKQGPQFLCTLKDVDRAALLGTDHGPAWRDLDVAVLHRGMLERMLEVPRDAELVYEPNDQKAVSYCTRGEKSLAVLMKGASASQIRACADAGDFMPQKATYIYPKLPTGAVIYRLD